MGFSNTILHKEIFQQPSILQGVLDNAEDIIFPVAKNLVGKFHSITIAARGTSDNAARYAQYLFGYQNRYPVTLTTPSLFSLYKTPPDMSGSLVIGISQSGQSPDICAVLDESRRMGSPTLALTNHSDSPLAKICEYAIPLQAGIEESVAATKSYTASLLCLALLSVSFSQFPAIPNYFFKIPAEVKKLIDIAHENQAVKQLFHKGAKGIVLGRGFNYATAYEISLKIKELTGLGFEPYSSADFRHGPISLVKKGDLAIIIGVDGPIKSDILEISNMLLAKSLNVISIGSIVELKDQSTIHFPSSPDIPEWLSPILTVIPGQLLAAMVGSEFGFDIDHPFDLQKITQTM